ncbi:MAG: guanylate kinase [Acidobacteria bacterium]|nr:guanylate kinase [Acidobacteriota bacterium]
MSSSAAPSVIVVSAPSGAGKSTVLKRVLREIPRIRFSVSHTTRPPRPGETEGVEYHFVSHEAFRRMIDQGRFLEWADVHGQRYGTSLDEYERARSEGVDLLLDLDVQGAAQVRVKVADAVTVFILPPSYEALERRLRGRGQDDEATIRRRLEGAYEEMTLYREYDYAVVNDDLDACVTCVEAVIRAARCRTSRAEPDAQAILRTFPSSKER